MAASAARSSCWHELRPEQRSAASILAKRDRGAISVYARNRDYHDVIKGRLKEIAARSGARPASDVKVFVDTAPVMEKPLAAAAGLGWQGKHTNLVSREFGSWLFLGAIFTDGRICARRAGERPLRHLPRLPRRLPDRRVPRALPARCAALHFLPDHRAQGADPARIPRRRSATASMAATIAWRSARGTSSRTVAREAKLQARDDLEAPPLCADLLALDDAAFRASFLRLADQAHRPQPVHAQCADRGGQQRRCIACCSRLPRLLDDPARWCAARRSGRLAQLVGIGRDLMRYAGRPDARRADEPCRVGWRMAWQGSSA